MSLSRVSICTSLALLLAPVAAQAQAEVTWKQDAEAQRVFAASFQGLCAQMLSQEQADDPADPRMRRFELQMPQSFSDPEPVVLWQFKCGAGAYNMIDVFLLGTEFSGIVPLALPAPVLDVTLSDPKNYESTVTDIKVRSWNADLQVVNANFDPDTLTLTEYSAWRGIGDAYSTSSWVLRDGAFEIRSHEVDAQYDGEQTPQLELSFGK